MNWKLAIVMNAWRLIFESKRANSDIMQVELVHPNIMGGRVRGRWFKNSVTGQATLRGFDFTVIDNGKQIPIRIIEQNPNKSSQYAQMARAGSKIAWVIRKDLPNGFTGRVQDGKWYKSGERAYTNVNPQPQMPAQTVPMEMRNLPEVNEAGIPDFVVRKLAEVENGLD